MRILMALLTFLVPCAALAQEVPFDPAPIQHCLESDPGPDCIGLGATACATAMGGTGAATCMMAEYAFLESVLRDDFYFLYEGELAADMILADLPRFAERPAGAPLLAEMQDRWMAWRETLCAYEALQGWNTDGEAFNEALCLMQLTGEKVLTLRRLAMGGG